MICAEVGQAVHALDINEALALRPPQPSWPTGSPAGCIPSPGAPLHSGRISAANSFSPSKRLCSSASKSRLTPRDEVRPACPSKIWQMLRNTDRANSPPDFRECELNGLCRDPPRFPEA